MRGIDLSRVFFRVEDRHLLMHAIARTTNVPYRHTCPLASFESVTHEIENAGAAGITREDLRERTGLAWTRINVAVVFLHERGIINREGKHGRLIVAASTFCHLDAMTEYHALAVNA